ncbi:complex I NDUFA9 subunit family protein [Algicella marina]|uniref:NAD(P)H-binding protein n=1 Tax=Algicella marina TaxID=2683284 RepID=A0A6P1T4X6_9RHOB|nr:complex I NDUFA9 subunit family protein [Algicella marina]QHQ36536.1 NAD(P)H-binding protein [Algicella marina]
MTNASPLVTIFGGSGFVGRYIARRMARSGWRVRVAVRRPNEALFVRTYGTVGQVEPVFANIRDDASVAAAVLGSSAVVNAVGILAPSGKQTFEEVQADGAGRIARAATAEGVASLVHISAIGADSDSESDYASSKALGEKLLIEAFPGAVILRPSIVFGPEDQFFNRFAGMARIAPFLPVIGADTRFQPVYVDDIAKAAEKAAMGKVEAGVYELGGPEVDTFRGLMERVLKVVRRRKWIAPIPFGVARVQGSIFDFLSRMSGGLLPAPVTRDQVTLLENDNVVSEGAKGFAELGIEPVEMAGVLEEYLYSYRPYGQYSDITESAKHMKA